MTKQGKLAARFTRWLDEQKLGHRTHGYQNARDKSTYVVVDLTMPDGRREEVRVRFGDHAEASHGGWSTARGYRLCAAHISIDPKTSWTLNSAKALILKLLKGEAKLLENS
jgi:hypothetical protein